MADMFAELDEALKQERMEKFWKNYGSFIITLIVAIIIGTGLFAAWRTWDSSVKETQTGRLLTALNATDAPAELLASAKDMRAGLEVIAKLNAAAILTEKKETQQAADIYKQIAADTSAPDEYRDLSSLALARIQSASDPQTALTTFQSIWNEEKSPFRYYAGLEAAVILADNNKNYQTAREYLAKILSAPGLPPSLSEKANALDLLYAMKESHDKS